VLGPDEPRYVAIGRTMAQTGDWITPRLWGSPWFEKPPLLYWMTAAGTAAGLNSELSGRLPVVLFSLAFLGTMFAPIVDRGVAGQGFTHKSGDVVRVSTEKLGVLENKVTTCDQAPPWSFGIADLMRNLVRRGLLNS